MKSAEQLAQEWLTSTRQGKKYCEIMTRLTKAQGVFKQQFDSNGVDFTRAAHEFELANQAELNYRKKHILANPELKWWVVQNEAERILGLPLSMVPDPAKELAFYKKLKEACENCLVKDAGRPDPDWAAKASSLLYAAKVQGLDKEVSYYDMTYITFEEYQSQFPQE